MDYRAYDEIVVLTGAGLSVASGLPTYRGKNGLWEGGGVHPCATAAVMQESPQKVWDFFTPLRASLLAVAPNDGHLALAAFEASRPAGQNFTVVTQNVDGLHQKAGSRNVVEIHGNLLRSRCSNDSCPSEPFVDHELYELKEPRCNLCGEHLRPDIVLFGEMLPLSATWSMKQAMRPVDLFIAVGTSGNVTPAATMVDSARFSGAPTVEFNLEPSGLFDYFIEGPAELTLPRELSGSHP